jgi:gamma-glutamylcyclotransferase (GGCT)/AIG2-like uncharacterized protein YtfP
MTNVEAKVIPKKQLVAVYGTLRKGFSNHSTMKQAKGRFIDGYWTPPGYCMYDYGGFPAVALDGMESIFLEIYEVEDMGILDFLEGYPDLYQRSTISSPYGVCWIYHMSRDQISLTCPQIKCGDWAKYTEAYSLAGVL